MEPGKEVSSPAPNSLWLLVPLGILASLLTIINLFSLKPRQPGAKPSKPVGPTNHSEGKKEGVSPVTAARQGIIPEDSEQAERGKDKPTPWWRKFLSWETVKKIGIVAGIGYALVTFYMYRQMVQSNELSLKAFETSQRSYMVLGRKDGVVAEFKKASDPEGWPSVTLYFQNAGRLPASTVCVQTTLTAWPIDPFPRGDGGPLIRQRGKNGQGKWETVESGCPTVGGDSVYSYVIANFFQQRTLDRITAEPTSDIRLSATIQHCDSFGHYSCKSASMVILRNTLTPYRMTEFDCTNLYGQVPALTYGNPGVLVSSTVFGTNDPLPPCLGDDPKTQGKQLVFINGWIKYLRSKEQTHK